MLLEPGLTTGSRSRMAPTLQGAIYPAPLEKREAVGSKMNTQEEATRKYPAGLSATEEPVISYNSNPAPWSSGKLPPTSAVRGSPSHYRSMESAEKVAIKDHRHHPSHLERPEPLYPPAPFKPRIVDPRLQPEMGARNAATSHRKPIFPGGELPPNAALPNHGLLRGVPARASAPTSSPSSSPVETSRTDVDPAAAAAAAAAFFHRTFHPGPLAAYPSPAGRMHGPAPQPPQPQSHAGLNPLPHAAYAGIQNASAAGFMSLAHILFQPKYPLGKKTFTCHECRYITDRKNNLKRHIATMHQDCGKFLECCDIVFKSKASMRDHVMMYHRTGYKCRFCGRNFCRKALLKRHLTVHNGQKEFICEVCDYATSHKSNLERHRKIHGLGSPIGSDDEEHFLRDGPDAELYRQYLLREKGIALSKEELHRRVMGSTAKSHVATAAEKSELYVDVETIHEDVISDISADDAMSVTSVSDVSTSFNTSQSRVSSTEKEAHPVSIDPLLEAFPVNSCAGKIFGKKSKGPLYLADRIRQTHEEEAPETTGAMFGNESPKTKSEMHFPGHRERDTDDEPVHFNREEKRPPPAHGVQPTEKSCSPPGEQRRAGLFKPASEEEDSKEARKLNRSLAGKGCKRLYASPYKCSECGLGLSSQRSLIEHSMACRKTGSESPRPMKPLTTVSHSEVASECARSEPTASSTPSVIKHASDVDKTYDIKLTYPAATAISRDWRSSASALQISPERHQMMLDAADGARLMKCRYPDGVTGQTFPAMDFAWNAWRNSMVLTSAAVAASSRRGDYSVRRLVGDDLDGDDRANRAVTEEARFASRRPRSASSPDDDDDEPHRLLPIKKRSVISHFNPADSKDNRL